jgi:hypothetical protein
LGDVVLRFGFSRGFEVPAPRPPPRHPIANPQFFNALPRRSNDMYKVIYKQYTLMLFSRVFAYTEPRSANQNLRLRVPRPILAPFLPLHPVFLITSLALCFLTSFWIVTMTKNPSSQLL